MEAGYVKKCRNLVEAMRYLNGERPVVSKGALISKLKDGVMKHRLILDCRVSGANSSTSKWERIILPRGWDLVKDSVRLKKLAVEAGVAPDLVYFFYDIADAFYKVPLLAADQNYVSHCVLKASTLYGSEWGRGALMAPPSSAD